MGRLRKLVVLPHRRPRPRAAGAHPLTPEASRVAATPPSRRSTRKPTPTATPPPTPAPSQRVPTSGSAAATRLPWRPYDRGKPCSISAVEQALIVFSPPAPWGRRGGCLAST